MNPKLYQYISTDPISLESTEIIISQIKNNLCAINLNDNKKAIGIFCKVPFPDEKNLLTMLKPTHTSNKEILSDHKQMMFNLPKTQK